MSSDTARGVYNWINSELQYVPSGAFANVSSPTIDQLKSTCIGQGSGIWKYLTEHVRSSRTCKAIRGNLAISKARKEKLKNTGSASDKLAELKAEREKLEYEISSTEEAIEALMNDICQSKTKLADSEMKNCLSKSNVSAKRTKLSLVKSNKHRLSALTAARTDAANALNSRTSHLNSLKSKKIEESEYFTVNNEGRSDEMIESNCQKKLREFTELYVGSLKPYLLSSKDGKTILSDRGRSKCQTLVNSLYDELPVGYVYNQLIKNVNISTNQLRELAQSVDVRTDAKQLQFRYQEEAGDGYYLMDTSEPPTVLQTVEQLIQDNQMQHIQIFIRAQELKNENQKLNKTLDDKLDVLYTEIDQLSENRNQNPAFIKEVIRLQLQSCAWGVSLDLVKNELVPELQEKIEEASHRQVEIAKKHARIQQFSSTVTENQSLICSLTNYNRQEKMNLEEKRNQLREYLCTRFARCVDDIKQCTAALHDETTREMSQFSQVKIPCLLRTSTHCWKRASCLDFSINHFTNFASGKNAAIFQSILKSLQFSNFKAPEHLLSHVYDLIKKEKDASSIIFSAAHKQTTPNREFHIDNLVKKVRESEREQLHKLVPLHQDLFRKHAQLANEQNSVRRLITEWWEHPAQHTTPWVQVDGEPYSKWLGEFRTHATNRKLQRTSGDFQTK